jgi:hypothetical protein
MPKKETPEMLLIKHLGKVAAKALFHKIDEMVAKGESTAKIEKLIISEIAAHIRKQLDKSVKIMIGQEKQPPNVKTGQKKSIPVTIWHNPPVNIGHKPPVNIGHKPPVDIGQKQPLNVKTGPKPKSK